MRDENTFAIKIPAWKYAEIEKKVVELYIKQKVCSFPIDPFEIIRVKGYRLIPFSKFNNGNRPECVSDDNDAFSFFAPNLETYIIVYNDNKPLPRIRFTLMHELGHIELGHKGESNLARRMADYYAGYALAPSPLIDIYASEEIPDIVSVFWVSNECADICSSRYQKWRQYCGKSLKDYEIRLVNLFK